MWESLYYHQPVVDCAEAEGVNICIDELVDGG